MPLPLRSAPALLPVPLLWGTAFPAMPDRTATLPAGWIAPAGAVLFPCYVLQIARMAAMLAPE
jgi:hypothetical protein